MNKTAGPEAASLRWQVCGRAILGRREVQEDAFDVGMIGRDGEERWLLVVADGMGGHAAGEHASNLAARAFRAEFESTSGSVPQRLDAALRHANDEIARAIMQEPRFAGMGCTLVAAHLSRDGLHWISVGDSPLWRWRDGELHRLNQDHSMRALLKEEVARGRMLPREAETHANRNALISAVAGDEIAQVDLSAVPQPLRQGDVVLLASDGLLTLSEDEIAAAIGEAARPRGSGAGAAAVVDTLLAEVERRNLRRQDNCTIVAAVWPAPSFLSSVRGWLAMGWGRQR